ncbi:hypothetical protein [Jeotgalibacillus malaysiensis]|uniref:hypothetical protein n=1 Tax=Jeotgalibacillus malaysiensis TaxID=1508404 RepID=UPI00384A5959
MENKHQDFGEKVKDVLNKMTGKDEKDNYNNHEHDDPLLKTQLHEAKTKGLVRDDSGISKNNSI